MLKRIVLFASAFILACSSDPSDFHIGKLHLGMSLDDASEALEEYCKDEGGEFTALPNKQYAALVCMLSITDEDDITFGKIINAFISSDKTVSISIDYHSPRAIEEYLDKVDKLFVERIEFYSDEFGDKPLILVSKSSDNKIKLMSKSMFSKVNSLDDPFVTVLACWGCDEKDFFFNIDGNRVAEVKEGAVYLFLKDRTRLTIFSESNDVRPVHFE